MGLWRLITGFGGWPVSGVRGGLATRPVFLKPGAFCNANERLGLQNHVSGQTPSVLANPGSIEQHGNGPEVIKQRLRFKTLKSLTSALDAFHAAQPTKPICKTIDEHVLSGAAPAVAADAAAGGQQRLFVG